MAEGVDYRRFEALAAELEAEEAAEAAAEAVAAGADDDEGAATGGPADNSPAGLKAAKAKAAGGLAKGGGGGGGELDDADLHPYFWDTIPENADEHPAMAAMEAMLEEDTPEERALNYKTQGNKKLAVAKDSKNKLYYREAVAFYTKGLAEECADAKLNAVLYSNRAQVQLTLGNNAKALVDALEAVKLDDTSIKSYFRGAQAALRAERWEQCEQLCEAGLARDSGATELRKIQQAVAKRRAERLEAEERRRAGRREAKTAAVSLAMAVTARGWQLGRPQFSVGGNARPSVDEEGMVHWPVVVTYPEVMTNDSIEDFHEAVTIEAHLDQMFAPGAPPLEWDSEGHYTRQRVELYYLANAGKPMTEDQIVEVFMGDAPTDFAEDGPQRFGSKSAVWVRVAESDALGEVLGRPDYIIPGVPVFFALAAGTAFRERFLANELKGLS